MSSIYMRETLQNAALHRLDPHGAAGFINGSSSTTWGVASVDLPVLYGSGLARHTTFSANTCTESAGFWAHLE